MKPEDIERIREKIRLLETAESSNSDNTSGYRAGFLIFYGFFLFHMLMFGGSGFFMAYFRDPPELSFLYIHGGIAIFAYLKFYNAFFGKDAVRWMVINALLGILGIYSELRIFLNFFDKNIDDYSIWVHVTPFTYYVLYTFLIYQTVLMLTNATANPRRKLIVEIFYVTISFGAYLALYKSY